MFNCTILADSINDRDNRLTTFLVTYPRMIHSEFMTHAMLARNGESSRARPVRKNIDDVLTNPFVPEVFGKNQPGMQWSEIVEDDLPRWLWIQASKSAATWAEGLEQNEVHKSLGNRLIEPFKWYTAIYSGTDWSNFFALRTHPDAQPEFQTIAKMMLADYRESEPRLLSSGEWHLPFVTMDEIETEARTYPEPFIDWQMWRQVSCGRCARTSHLTHEGKRDLEADITLVTERLAPSGHMSPFAHQARPFTGDEWMMIDELHEMIDTLLWPDISDVFKERLQRNLKYCAQYRGWWQARADIPNEDDFSRILNAVH